MSPGREDIEASTEGIFTSQPGLEPHRSLPRDLGWAGFAKRKGVIRSRLGTLQPMATWPAAYFFANKLLLEHSHLIHLHIACGLSLCHIRGELLRQRHMTRKTENIYCLAFYRRTCLSSPPLGCGSLLEEDVPNCP